MTDPLLTATTTPVTQEQSVSDLIRRAAKAHGLSSHTAIEIARCESNVMQFTETGELLRGRTTPKDVGIFQINEYYHLEPSQKLGFDIHTVDGNIGYAMWLMKKEGTTPWNWSKPCWGAKV